MKTFIRYNLLPIIIIIITSPFSYSVMGGYSNSSINSVKAVVDEEIITQEDVVKRAAIAIKEAQDRYGDAELLKMIDQILQDTLQEIIDRKVLIKEANKLFGTNEAMMKEVDKELNSFVKGAVKNVGSLPKYYEIAAAQGINPIEKKNELKEDIMIDKIVKENVHNKVSIQPKVMRRYYSENIDEFRQKKEVKLRHLMVKFSAHNNDKEETLSITQKILKRIDKGENFSSVAKQCSEGPNAEDGGLCTVEEVNELRKDLRDVVYSLKDNACSKIVESPVGYHVFKVELIKP